MVVVDEATIDSQMCLSSLSHKYLSNNGPLTHNTTENIFIQAGNELKMGSFQARIEFLNDIPKYPMYPASTCSFPD